MSRWSKSGVLDRVFEKLQTEQIVRIKIEAFSLDSTSIKVHPDGTGALKIRTANHRQIARRM
jgi:lactam utilization protein B